jgi:hypothetical protein
VPAAQARCRALVILPWFVADIVPFARWTGISFSAPPRQFALRANRENKNKIPRKISFSRCQNPWSQNYENMLCSSIMKPRICISCGEEISEPGNELSGNPNLCALCSSLIDGTDFLRHSVNPGEPQNTLNLPALHKSSDDLSQI